MYGTGCLFGMLVFDRKVNVATNPQAFIWKWVAISKKMKHAASMKFQGRQNTHPKVQMHLWCVSIVNCRHGRLDCSQAAIGVDLTVISMDSSTYHYGFGWDILLGLTKYMLHRIHDKSCIFCRLLKYQLVWVRKILLERQSQVLYFKHLIYFQWSAPHINGFG